MAKKKFEYINESDQDQVVIGIGLVKSKKKFKSDKIINNPNFRMVGIDPVTKPKRIKK